MQFLNENLWNINPTDRFVRLITTNGIVKSNNCLVMGKGVALQAKERYPEIDLKLGVMVKIYGNHPYYLPEYQIISFPTKHDWKQDSDHILIKVSAITTLKLVEMYQIKKIYLPKVGCGNGNLNWGDVKSLLDLYFDDRFIVCEEKNEKSN